MPRLLDRPRFSACIVALMALGLVSPALAQDAKPAAEAPSLVPAEAPVVIAFRPAALLKLPDVKALYDEFTRQDEVKRIVDVAEPETIEEITLVLLRRDLKLDGDPGDDLAAAGAVIVKTNKPREWKALAAAAGVPVVKATHAGKDYYRMSGDAPMAFGFYQPSETTLVVGTEANLRKIIEDKGDGGAKPPRLAKPNSTTIASAAVDIAWARGLFGPAIQAETGSALALSVVRPIWEKTDDMVVNLAMSEAGMVTLTADHMCKDEDGAKLVAKTAEALLTLGQNVAPEGLKLMRQQSKGDPTAAEVADLAEQAIKTASVVREGTRVRLQVSVKADVAKLAKLASGR